MADPVVALENVKKGETDPSVEPLCYDAGTIFLDPDWWWHHNALVAAYRAVVERAEKAEAAANAEFTRSFGTEAETRRLREALGKLEMMTTDGKLLPIIRAALREPTP